MDNQHWWQDQTAGRSCTQAGDACDHDDDEEEDMFGYDDDDVDWVGDIWIADNWGPNEHLRNGTPATASASTVHWVWCAGSHLSIKINLTIVVIITSITIVTNLLSAELSESDIVDSCIGLNILHLFGSNDVNMILISIQISSVINIDYEITVAKAQQEPQLPWVPKSKKD